MINGSLFDFVPAKSVLRAHAWTPESPPCLDGISEIQLNFETTGLQWWEKDRPIAASLRLPDGRSYYLPWGHRGGGNLDEAVVKRFFHEQVKHKTINNINTRFDVHNARVWGVDLEAQGNRLKDVGHSVALLEDHRQRSSLDTLIVDFFGRIEVPRVDESRMADYHAGECARRSIYNVEMVARLEALLHPQLVEQDLLRVKELENRVIYPVCEMEKNGAPIDLELLDRWERESKERLNKSLLELAKECGFQVNPDSNKDLQKVFEKFKLPLSYTPKGAPSFTEAILKKIDHPVLKLLRRTGKLIDLRSKYLVKIKRCISSDGILRYALHQLRAVKDSMAENPGEAGTVTGRFSSTELVPKVGLNIQQIMKVAKQRVQWGYEEDDASHDDEIFVIRQLFKPASGLFLSADAAQIEYRLFANYAQNPKILKAYEAENVEDPESWISFHKLTHGMIKPFKPDQTYRQQKDLNFAQIYGAQTIKLAVMLEFISKEFGEHLKETKQYDHPDLRATKEIQKIYHREIPEVAPLQALATHLARPSCVKWCRPTDKLHRAHEHQGYVRDLLGRRSRFPEGYGREHKALNSVIQPGAATINKQKLVEVHEARNETGFTLRYSVHDEMDGDVPDLEAKRKVSAILNRQSFPELKIKILWDVNTGANWKECA